MIKERKIGKTAAVVASIAALGLGGATIAGATGVGSGGQSEQASEANDNVTGPDADRASAAAEKSTGGKATEVEREDAASGKETGADKDAGEKGEFQTPSNTAYEVEVDNGGKEIDVYLDKSFQVITTHVDSEADEDSVTGPNADRASTAAEKATGGKATDVEREDASPAKEKNTDANEKGEFQTPSNAAYEVEVDKGGKEIDVYLDQGFQVITTHPDN